MKDSADLKRNKSNNPFPEPILPKRPKKQVTEFRRKFTSRKANSLKMTQKSQLATLQHQDKSEGLKLADKFRKRLA